MHPQPSNINRGKQDCAECNGTGEVEKNIMRGEEGKVSFGTG